MKGGVERGSILLFVLFVCLAVAVVVQTLSAALLCAERAAVDESVGRRRSAEREEGLRWLRGRASLSWAPFTWQEMVGGPEKLEGRLDAAAEGAGWVMEAAVRQPALSGISVWARAERGRDGIDLPQAALVAGRVVQPSARTDPWLETVSATETARAYLVQAPPGAALGPGCGLVEIGRVWHLDDGWRGLVQQWIEQAAVVGSAVSGRAVSGSLGSVTPGPGVTLMGGRPGQTLSLDDGVGSLGPPTPALVVVVGGATLDLRGRGDVYGVVVVDSGGLLLDGTRVHGAVFVTEVVDVGDTGGVVFERGVLRWATDRSLTRVRLVPGSRQETIE